MRLYEVDYPFEVDAVGNVYSIVYTTRNGAIAHAAEVFANQADEEQDYDDGATRLTERPATLSVCTTGKLSAGFLCNVINSNGGSWQASATVLGTLHYADGRIKFRKAKVTQ